MSEQPLNLPAPTIPPELPTTLHLNLLPLLKVGLAGSCAAQSSRSPGQPTQRWEGHYHKLGPLQVSPGSLGHVEIRQSLLPAWLHLG